MTNPDKDPVVYAVTSFLMVCVFVMVLILSGCSTFEYAARYTVDSYCAIPERERVAVRWLVNSRIHPDKIIVECAELPDLSEMP